MEKFLVFSTGLSTHSAAFSFTSTGALIIPYASPNPEASNFAFHSGSSKFLSLVGISRQPVTSSVL